jgi:2-polyprenyl-3-methyl-5-hydroxy-6-metoxy-1,4-benzoquinol methylase
MSDDLEQAVARHYGRGDITKPILDGLKSAGVDIDGLSLEDLAPVDEFHIGGRAASEDVLAKLALTPDHHVLDIGCGIGGTARYMAKAFGCRVSGIDLTPEFIETARRLSERTGLPTASSSRPQARSTCRSTTPRSMPRSRFTSP